VSQFGGNEVKTVFTVDSSEVAPKVDAAQAKVEGFKRSAEEGGEAVAGGFKKSISAVTSFIGSLTAAVGVATLFYNIGQKIRDVYFELFASGSVKAKEFVDSINSIDAKKNIESIESEISRLQQRLDKALRFEGDKDATLFTKLLFGDPKDLEEQIAKLTQAANAFRQQQEAQRKRQKEAEEELGREKERQADLQQALDERAADNQEKRARERAAAFEAEQAETIRRADAELDAARQKYHEEDLKRIQERRDKELEAIQAVRDELRQLNAERERGFGLDNVGALGVSRSSELVDLVRRRTGR